jgi:hypothetical protein
LLYMADVRCQKVNNRKEGKGKMFHTFHTDQRAIFHVKKTRLVPRMTENDRRWFAGRHHFGMEEMPRIDAMYLAILPLLRAQGCYGIQEGIVQCAVTLGERIDALQELYTQAGALTEAYMLECLGCALLDKACDQLENMIYQETGLYMQEYDFPGSEIPIEKMQEILQKLSEAIEDFPISCNEQFVMQPKKSVTFRGGLGLTRRTRSLCASCTNKDCESRQDIFQLVRGLR